MAKERTRAEIIRDLKPPYTDSEAEKKLNALVAEDPISEGTKETLTDNVILAFQEQLVLY